MARKQIKMEDFWYLPKVNKTKGRELYKPNRNKALDKLNSNTKPKIKEFKFLTSGCNLHPPKGKLVLFIDPFY